MWLHPGAPHRALPSEPFGPLLRKLLSRPIHGNVWSASVLWVTAWLCCLVRLTLTLGRLSVMVEPATSHGGSRFSHC